MVVDPLPHVQSEPRSHQRGELWPPCPQRLEQTRTGLDRNTTHGMLPRVCVCGAKSYVAHHAADLQPLAPLVTAPAAIATVLL